MAFWTTLYQVIDLVLADRGFTVHESFQFQQAKLNIPAFTKGKDQLDSADVEQTRKIATVQIHVERIIGLLRQKYTILQQTLPTDYLILFAEKENLFLSLTE